RLRGLRVGGAARIRSDARFRRGGSIPRSPRRCSTRWCCCSSWGGSSGSIPRDFDLDEVDAVLDCAAFWDLAGVDPEDELPIGCADGSFTTPETLADGHYYWQVRGFGISALTGDTAGPWSTVGHFIVGEAPAGPGA